MLVPTILAEDAPHFLRGVGVLPLAVFFPALGLAFLETAFKRFRSHVRFSPAENWGLGFAFRLLPIILFLFGLYSTVDAYFFRYAHVSSVYHWFESGPVALAGRINALLERGWNGQRMLPARMLPAPHSRAVVPQGQSRLLSERQIYIDRKVWDAWTAIPFLVPETVVDFLPLAGAFPDPDRGMAFVVWPYRAWEPSVLPYLTHPAYLSLAIGPQAQGDLDPEPYTIAMIARREPLANITVPDPIARFERGIVLHAALVYDNLEASVTDAVRSPGREALRIRLWWGTSARLKEPYTVFVHYLRDGERIAQDDEQPGHGHLPTSSWRPGDLIMDEHILLGEGLYTPTFVPDPARDTLRLGMYHGDTLEGLSWLDSAGNPAGAWFDWPVILSE